MIHLVVCSNARLIQATYRMHHLEWLDCLLCHFLSFLGTVLVSMVHQRGNCLVHHFALPLVHLLPADGALCVILRVHEWEVQNFQAVLYCFGSMLNVIVCSKVSIDAAEIGASVQQGEALFLAFYCDRHQDP
ncbi:hypothetical protein DM01DRAFT_1202471 [Hesseltinella vesiculosa]|uniref:Uncharacterized protein n=1 Tax=Hesseltinella vesiculosa TaxID=101127 RepID=A0A1X2G316_9FUNG|nr:hypothetical protein DM01DRAFT_1202471 [Hesseltinella vesiculosa]